MPDSSANENAVLERLRGIIAEVLRIPREQVKEDADLVDDLGAESLDLVDFTYSCEEAFGIVMPEKNILEVAEEVFGPDVLQTDGYLTAEGRRFLERRMPDFDLSAYQDAIPLEDVQKAFMRVSVWARMIEGLIDALPTECDQCGASGLAAATPGFLKCSACGAETKIAHGDRVHREWVENYRTRTQ